MPPSGPGNGRVSVARALPATRGLLICRSIKIILRRRSNVAEVASLGEHCCEGLATRAVHLRLCDSSGSLCIRSYYTAAKLDCLYVDRSVIEAIARGLTVTGGGTLRDASAIPNPAALGSHFVAAEIDGQRMQGIGASQSSRRFN